MDFLLLFIFLISNENLAHKSDTFFTFIHFNQRSNLVYCQMHMVHAQGVHNVLVNNHVFTWSFVQLRKSPTLGNHIFFVFGPN